MSFQVETTSGDWLCGQGANAPLATRSVCPSTTPTYGRGTSSFTRAATRASSSRHCTKPSAVAATSDPGPSNWASSSGVTEAPKAPTSCPSAASTS